MQANVSIICTPSHGISNLSANTQQHQHKVKTQDHLFRKFEHEKLKQMKYKFHVTNFHVSSIPIDKAIDVILQQLSEGYEHLKARTKLTLTDIQQLDIKALHLKHFADTQMIPIPDFGVKTSQDLQIQYTIEGQNDK